MSNQLPGQLVKLAQVASLSLLPFFIPPVCNIMDTTCLPETYFNLSQSSSLRDPFCPTALALANEKCNKPPMELTSAFAVATKNHIQHT